MSRVRVAFGHLFFFFAYDVGWDIALEEAKARCSAAESPGLLRLRAGPAHVQYRPRPLVLHAAAPPVRGEGKEFRPEAQVKIFDFGAISVLLSLPVRETPWEEFAAAAISLATEGTLEPAARKVAQAVFEQIRPAVAKANFEDLVEEYAMWHVGEFDPPMTGTQALEAFGMDIARLIALERGTFAAAALPEILRNPIRYFENDLLLMHWNAAFAYDPKFQDTAEVLEFLNVQMLELRYFDRVLTAALDEVADELHRKLRPFLFHDPYEKPLRRLSGIKTEVSMLRERVDNTLKLVGDAYLARVFEEARRKAGAPRWEAALRDRIKALEDIYTILNNRAAAARAETLEIIIILLIALEIAMGLIKC